MTISVKPAIHSHVNEAFATRPMLETLDFVKRLYIAEFDQLRERAKEVLEPTFYRANHSDAYQTIVQYALERQPLTEVIRIIDVIDVSADIDIIEHNLMLLAQKVDSYDTTIKFFKKRDLVAEVAAILTPQPIAVAGDITQ